MKDYKLKLRDLHDSDTLGGAQGMISSFFLGIDWFDYATLLGSWVWLSKNCLISTVNRSRESATRWKEWDQNLYLCCHTHLDTSVSRNRTDSDSGTSVSRNWTDFVSGGCDNRWTCVHTWVRRGSTGRVWDQKSRLCCHTHLDTSVSRKWPDSSSGGCDNRGTCVHAWPRSGGLLGGSGESPVTNGGGKKRSRFSDRFFFLSGFQHSRSHMYTGASDLANPTRYSVPNSVRLMYLSMYDSGSVTVEMTFLSPYHSRPHPPRSHMHTAYNPTLSSHPWSSLSCVLRFFGVFRAWPGLRVSCLRRDR